MAADLWPVDGRFGTRAYASCPNPLLLLFQQGWKAQLFLVLGKGGCRSLLGSSLDPQVLLAVISKGAIISNWSLWDRPGLGQTFPLHFLPTTSHRDL